MNKTNMTYSLMNRVLLILFFAITSGCGNDETPSGILSEKEMIPIMLDIYLAEGKVNELRIKRDSSLRIFEVYEAKILEKYKLEDSVYTNSLRYYYDNPVKLESIYETVLDSLNLLEKRLDEVKEDDLEENKKDTLDVKPDKTVGV